jgi:hypothetical protein
LASVRRVSLRLGGARYVEFVNSILKNTLLLGRSEQALEPRSGVPLHESSGTTFRVHARADARGSSRRGFNVSRVRVLKVQG